MMAEPGNEPGILDLPNFRVLYSQNSDKEEENGVGLLYRSSRPDLLNDDDMVQFQKLGIRSVIDFRSKQEYAKADGEKLLDSVSSLHVVKIPHRSAYKPHEEVKCKLINSTGHYDNDQTNTAAGESPSPTETESESSREHPRLKHYLINFFTGKYIWTVFLRAPWYLKLYSLFWMLIDLILGTDFKYFVQIFATYVLNPTGLIGQYKDIVDLSQRSICAALKLLTDPENIPALINCAHGKDRTGIVTALIMSCLGHSKEEISKEYSRSAEGLQPVIERVHREIVIKYHMSEEFVTSNQETMLGLLEYITEQYGSVENYLESIGFSLEEQEQLRRNLICTEL